MVVDAQAHLAPHLPDLLPLRLVPGAQHPGGALPGHHCHHLGHLRFDRCGRPVQFDDEQRGPLARHGKGQHLADDRQAAVIEELDGAGQMTLGHDPGHGAHGVGHGAEGAEHAGGGRRFGQELEGQGGDHRQRPLAAHQQVGQVVADHALAGAHAGGDQAAVGQDRLQAEDVVAGGAVLDAGRAAGVGGRVAADGAQLHAGRVGRVEQPPGGRGLAHPLADGAGLDLHDEINGVDGADSVETSGGEDHAAQVGQAGPGQAGPAAPGCDRETVGVGQGEQGLDVGHAVRAHHQLGEMAQAGGVAGIVLQPGGLGDEGAGREAGLQFGADGRGDR